eukprot:SAG31_NODE_10286_length_1160_cov_1.695570_2_plen_195_part_01
MIRALPEAVAMNRRLATATQMLTLFQVQLQLRQHSAHAACSRTDVGCYSDCWDVEAKAQSMKMNPSMKLYRTLPFGVDGCCSGAPFDPRGPCKGECGEKLCVQSGDPPVDQCPPANLATCPPKCDTAAMSLDKCAQFCDQLGYRYSGVEYANQCFCGHSIAEWATIDSSGATCKSGCAGCPGGSSSGFAIRLDVQ